MSYQITIFLSGILLGVLLTTLLFHVEDNVDQDVLVLHDTGDGSQFIEREEVPLYTEEEQDISDFVALPYEQTGGVFSIPMTVVSKGQQAKDIWMIFDTGASISTLDSKTLAELGITKIPDDAPTLQFRTANGLRESPIVLIDQIWMGGYLVGPVTFAVCESCSKDDVRGLLGLNVSDFFLVTIDTLHKELLLQPRKKQHLRTDVRHWISISSAWKLRGLEIDVVNSSPQTIYDLRIQLQCDETIRIRELASQDSKKTLVKNLSCSGVNVGSIRGRFLP